jgi:hypothetical protein
MGTGRKLKTQHHREEKLERMVAELQAIVDSYSPKRFVKSSCPYFGECVLADCDGLSVKCSHGDERNCLECADFNNDERCDNWSWRNCTIARAEVKQGKKQWSRNLAKLTQVNIHKVREQVKVI